MFHIAPFAQSTGLHMILDPGSNLGSVKTHRGTLGDTEGHWGTLGDTGGIRFQNTGFCTSDIFF